MKAVLLLACLIGSTLAIPMAQLYFDYNPALMAPQILQEPQQQIPDFVQGGEQSVGPARRASFEIIVPYGAQQQPGSLLPSRGFIKQSIPQPGRPSLEILYPFGFGNTGPMGPIVGPQLLALGTQTEPEKED
uniref:Secretory calcium-binding phosphosphoprotein 7 n=1 Tax=Lepisosteus oculatus TaxID=7918 RepID=A0A125R3L7_LEPOC|nr:secretory calcium-binding phosphosphoprotein 7 [Lepisosteus oculatus]